MTPEETPLVPYPRNVFFRRMTQIVGRALLGLLTRTTVAGRENLPEKGPLILVGNHNALMEAALMVLHSPYQIELLGAGDIPFDPRYAWAIERYGYIPIRRGEMDRLALNKALGVLKQGGVIGMFPEGGIWEAAFKRARTGVSWLSSQANAPIIPIGFGGIDGALGATMKLRRPRMLMNIGHVIPPIPAEIEGKSRKEALEDGARMVMQQIAALIPEEDKQRWNRIRNERFELQLVVRDSSGEPVTLPPELEITVPEMLAKYFHRPLMLDVLARNLNLPIQPLQRLHREHDPAKLAPALKAAVSYYDAHPNFLPYRFPYVEASGMHNGLRQLHRIAEWSIEHNYQVEVIPIRRYQQRGSDQEIVEYSPGSIPAL